MFFERRPIAIRELDDAGELVDKLLNYSWTLCTAFRLGHLLFINDATSEDGAGEWAVVIHEPQEGCECVAHEHDGCSNCAHGRCPVLSGVQIESITFGWIDDPVHALDLVLGCIKEAPSMSGFEGSSALGDPLVALVSAGYMSKPATIHPHPAGSCPLCA